MTWYGIQLRGGELKMIHHHQRTFKTWRTEDRSWAETCAGRWGGKVVPLDEPSEVSP